jgi:phage terminase large subunit-like protein
MPKTPNYSTDDARDDAGDRAVLFIEKYLRHVKGELGGHPLILQDWQEGYVRRLFGTLREDGLRQYRTTLLAIPRKSGKSTLAAALALKLLFADNEPGAEVFSCAADTGQAKVVFDIAKGMVEQSPILSSRCKIYRNSIVIPKTYSQYRALSSESTTKHGLSASGIVFDELHAQPDSELWRVMTSSTGARRQPLTIAITTAGSRRESIAYQLWKYAEQVRDGIIEDPSFLPLIYAADPADDWTLESTWRKANPRWDDRLLEDLRIACDLAKQINSEESSFRMLRLNQWVNSEQAWMRQIDWEACSGSLRPDLQGKKCFCGLDLSATFDTTAFIAVWPHDDGTFDVLPMIWLPEENVAAMMQRDKVPYDAWIRAGHIRTTPGKSTNFETVKRDILHFATQANIAALAVDRWQAEMISQHFVGEGINCEKWGQGYGSLSAPAKILEGLVANRNLRHAGHPVLAWQASNATIQQDSAGNIKPCKAKSTGRIDAVVALVMALGVYAAGKDKEPELNWNIAVL